MIQPDSSIFPNNIMERIKVAIPLVVDSDMAIFMRPLRPTDPNQCIGISAGVWDPDEESFEMSPVMKPEPTLQNYTVLVQSLVKHADEQTALNIHAVVAKRIRSMLYRYSLLQLAFAELQDTSDGKTESAQRWGPRSQRFISNEVNGTFLQSSITEFWLQTATG